MLLILGLVIAGVALVWILLPILPATRSATRLSHMDTRQVLKRWTRPENQGWAGL